MMRAFRRTAPDTLEPTEIPTPAPGPGEVLLAVDAVGICHTDLHILDAPAGDFPVPLTLGHEISGRVTAVGDGVTDRPQGQAVAVFGLTFCGRCPACLAGRENQCRVSPIGGIGLTRDGGLADHVVVPAAQLVAVPAGLDPVTVAPLPDAGLSPYHAIATARPVLRPGSTCVVIGVGGLGHLAIQILRATTAATVLAVDTSEEALRLADRVGAHHTLRAGPQTADRIREFSATALGGGVDAVIDCVGSDATLELSRTVLAKGGYLLLVGLGGGQLTLSPAPGSRSFPAEANVRQSFWGTRGELTEVLSLAKHGQLTPEIRTFPFEETESAYDLLRRGEIHGRAVVVL
ncbi:NAD(P)-dependent alcohol dehydrogenase [Streptomyces prunicolor]